jgi:aldehyde dehydrogenase
MRIFQEEIFGPVVSVTRFTDFDDAMHDRQRHAVRPRRRRLERDINTAYRAGRAIQAGRVWTNCYHPTPRTRRSVGTSSPASAGRTTPMMLEHYQQTKNLLVSYAPDKLGFFSRGVRAAALGPRAEA